MQFPTSELGAPCSHVFDRILSQNDSLNLVFFRMCRAHFVYYLTISRQMQGDDKLIFTEFNMKPEGP